TITSYQWYRVPEGGNITNNGQAITGANAPDYQLDSINDINFEHQLFITLDNGSIVNSERTTAWQNNNSDPTDANIRERYYDVVTINDGTTPLQNGQTITAQLSGSSLIKDTQPPVLTYQWQSRPSNTAGTWNNISANSPTLTLSSSENGQDIRVLVERSDMNGVILPRLVSLERSVASTPNPLLPWRVTLTQSNEYVVGQPISASHRSTTDSVDYQWYQLSTASDWDNATIINNANDADYILRSDDVGYFIGVVATISDGNNSLEAEQNTSSPIKATNLGSSDSYYLDATLSPSPKIYQNSTLSYNLSLYKNNVLVDNPQGSVTSQWYLIDKPEQKSTPSSWLALNDTTLSNTAAGKYVLLKLDYNEPSLTNPLSIELVSDSVVQSRNTPNDFATWYSIIEMTPNQPIDKNSRPSLIKAENSTESVTERDNVYTVKYQFSPSIEPSKDYDDLASLMAAHTGITSVIVSATQSSGGLSRDLKERTFTLSDEFVYDIRHITPALDYSIPLNIDNDIKLLNQDEVEAQVSALDAALTVNYQWQYHNGNDWQDVGLLLPTYEDLDPPLTTGERYRLKLIATDGALTSHTLSDETTAVENNSVRYNIEFDDLAQPQEGIEQTVNARLISNVPPAQFAERKVTWTRIDDNTSTTHLSDNDRYKPVLDDVNKALKVTLSFYDDTGNLLSQRSINTQAVLAQSGSSALDDLANRLTLSITPTVLARQATVSLHRDDVTAIMNETNILASYQWQRRDANGGNWSPIPIDGNAFNYTAVANDDNHYLRLQLILSTTNVNGNTIQLAPLYSNQTELVTPNADGPLETLTLDFDANTYSLTERATIWLN
ncbi:hypothetical protein UB34_20525, partial [Photobacterium leiognathi]|uniref:hypothetical protein n=1 Tax=Photobacterium leiognathi TaxID=553611 RepID=UPI0005D33D0F